MRQLLITAVALVAVLAGGTCLLSVDGGAAGPQLEASMSAYCNKSRAPLGYAYIPKQERGCRSARRLFG